MTFVNLRLRSYVPASIIVNTLSLQCDEISTMKAGCKPSTYRQSSYIRVMRGGSTSQDAASSSSQLLGTSQPA
ncbi:hypothetical protein CBM2605_A260066 [Cupriavidus neocaledonicus]|uniref:Uncharacterized protein n=1 Tax=Cupriavidus neocaledonicus TaxID=1040979 RepID=A0ABY1V1H1_9BURK|nr:hypothetical protein CBM2605_A260066 [Cupriavidus neocaledonicus]